MSGSRKLASLFLLCALLVLAVAPAVFAQSFTPLIYALDQDVVDGNVTVVRVVSDGPGWIVVEADDNGAPGEVLGQLAVPNGISANLAVPANVPAGTTVLHIMLHQDLGTEGVFEWPGADEPAMVDGDMIMSTIAVGEVGASLVAVARENGFSTLLEAAAAAGLADELAGGGPYTVFAPTDDAFAALPAGTLDSLLDNPDTLAEILLYHVVPGVVESSALTESVMVPSVQGEELDIQVGDDGITVNGANVTTADVKAYNGVIHVVDAVLLPPSIVAAQAAAAEEAAAAEALAATAVVTESAVMTEAVAMTETAGVTESAVVTEAMPMTETAAMTESAVMTEAMPMTETAAMTEAVAMTETAAMTESAVMTEAMPMTETAAMTESAVMTEAMPMTETVAATETAEVAPAEVVTETADAAPAADAAPETLPATGGSSLPSLSVLAGGLVLLVLVAAAFITRRRTA